MKISALYKKCEQTRKRLAIGLCLLCTVTTLAQAQITQKSDDYSLNRNPDNYGIATPNAAVFNRYTDNPVDLYSGNARIEIPVYTLKDGCVEIPIRLTYATSGIKVNEEAGWTGLGWSLEAGGFITRQVVGQIDCYSDQPYYKKVTDECDRIAGRQAVHYVVNPWGMAMRDSMDWFLLDPIQRKAHREGRFNPDIFTYSCPEGNGRFVIDSRDNSICLLDRREDVKIEMETDSGFSIGQSISSGRCLVGFRLTFPNGTVHRFDLLSIMDTSIPVYLGVQAETYALVKTVYPNGQTVNYSYDTTAWNNGFNYGETTKSFVPSSFFRPDLNTAHATKEGNSHSRLSLVNCSGREVLLSKITTDNYEIHFKTSLREDLPNLKKLDRIYVKNLFAEQPADSCCRDYRFVYDYFVSANTGNYWSRRWRDFSFYRQTEHMLKRLKLNTVYATGDGREEEKYTFTYNSKTLPRKDSYATDYWGYYNGKTDNDSYIPDPYYLMWHDLATFREIENLPRDNWTTLLKAKRGYDFECCKASILTGIRYPTGGYAEITYEPHRFVDYFVPTLAQTQTETPMNNLTVYDNNSFFAPDDLYPSPKSKFYSFKKDKEVVLNLSLYRGSNSWQSVADHRAYIYYVENGTPKKIDLSLKAECEAQPATSYTVTKIYKLRLKKGTGYFVVDLPDALGDQTTGSGTNAKISMLVQYEKDGLEEKRESEGAGIRIKEVNFYDSPSKGVLLQRTSYAYVTPDQGTCSGLLLNKLQFLNFYPQTYDKLGSYSSTACNFDAVTYITCRSDKLELSGSNFFSSPYQPSVDVGYTYVKETRHGNGQEGYTWYKFHNEEPMMEEHSVPLYSPLNGALLETSAYDAGGKLLHRTQNVYEAPIYHYYYGLNFYDRINLFPELFDGRPWQCMVMDENPEYPFNYQACNNFMFYANMKFHHRSFEHTYVGGGTRLSMVMHPLNFHNILLKEKRVWNDGVETVESYVYNPQTLQLKEKQMTLSDGSSLKVSYTYPNDCAWGDYTLMTQMHFIAPVIEEKKFKNGLLTEGVLTEYKQVSRGFFLPSAQCRSEITIPLAGTTPTFTSSGRNRTIYPADNILFLRYDNYGHPLTLSVNNQQRSFLWGYKGQYLLAEITNVSYDTVKAALASLGSVTPESLSEMPVPDWNILSALRTKFPYEHIRLYKHKNQAGVSLMTRPNGETVSYEYDSFLRLKETKDYNGKTVEEHGYHYKP